MIYLVLFFVTGLLLLTLALLDVKFVRHTCFFAVALGAIIFLLARTFVWGAGAGIPFLLLAVVASLPAGFYIGICAGGILYDMFDFFSLAGLRVKKTFDQGDAAVQRHDYDEAERLYQAALKDNRSNVELRRRLADLYVTTHSFDEAIAELREVGRLSKRPENICLAAFERAEILADEKKDIAAAIEEIRAVLKRFPDGASAVFARERLAQLEKRLDG